MRRGATARWLALAAVLLLTVAGCTGVPGSSTPQVVRTIGLGESPPPSAPAPPNGASQRSIVSGFIDAMRTSPDQLDAARAYLDSDATQRWSDTTVTIVRDGSLVIGSENPADDTVPIQFQEIGSLSADGVYSPVLTGDGANAVAVNAYALAKNQSGQWRITTPVPRGLFLTASEFAGLYSPKPLYFQDLSLSRLVPDLRYSALTEPALETFLLTQLIAGPRPELANAVVPFQVTPTGAQRASVSPGSPTVVQIPGAAASDPSVRTRLAAQLAFTLRPSSFQSDLQLRDGNQIISVPGVGDTFDYTDFGDLAPVSESGSTTVTYVRGGAVVDATGKAVYGTLGTAAADLDTAVFDDDGPTRVAATTGTAGPTGRRSLLLGDVNGLADTRVPVGPLSAPAWAPVGTGADTDEVWVSRGAQLWRVVPGKEPVPVRATAGNTSLTGTISSLSFSPEGTRLALVIQGAGGSTSQVWIGSVVRDGPDVRLDALIPITPRGIDVSDVGWRTETLLAGVGTAAGYSPGVYFDVAVDGSRLTRSSPTGLPERALTIAVSPRTAEQWATVGTGSDATVWTRASSNASWAAPAEGASQSGSAPSFST